MRQAVCIGCLIVLALGLMWSDHGLAQTPNPEIMLGSPAPDFTLNSLTGESVSLKDLKGKIVVLDFWATWCRPCRMYMPDVIAVTEEYKDKDVVLYAVNQGDPKDAVAKFVELTKLNANILLDIDRKVGSEYFVSSIPQTVIIGKDGTVQSVHIGAGKKSELKKELETLASGKNLTEPKKKNAQ